MVFTECTRDQRMLPCGTFYVMADGDKEKLQSSFTEFMQNIGHCALPEQ